MALVLLCGDDDDEDGCLGDQHDSKELKCGHPGCSYYLKKGCRVWCTESKKEEKEEESAMLKDVSDYRRLEYYVVSKTSTRLPVCL